MKKVIIAVLVSSLLTSSMLPAPSVHAVQGPGGEVIVRRPPNPPTQNLKPGRTDASRVRAQVEIEIQRGNRARDEATLSAQMDRIASGQGEVPLESFRAKAERHYRRAIALNPNEWRAHYGLGNLYSDQGKNDEAIKAYQRALVLKPKNADVYVALADVYFQHEQPIEAFQAYQNAIQADSRRAELHVILGDAYFFKSHDFVAAAKAYEHAIRLGVKTAEVHFNLGYSYFQMKRYHDAVSEYKTTIQLAEPGKWVNARYELGVAYLRLGDKQAAMEQYHELRRQPIDRWGYADALLKEINRQQ